MLNSMESIEKGFLSLKNVIEYGKELDFGVEPPYKTLLSSPPPRIIPCLMRGLWYACVLFKTRLLFYEQLYKGNVIQNSHCMALSQKKEIIPIILPPAMFFVIWYQSGAPTTTSIGIIRGMSDFEQRMLSMSLDWMMDLLCSLLKKKCFCSLFFTECSAWVTF